MERGRFDQVLGVGIPVVEVYRKSEYRVIGVGKHEALIPMVLGVANGQLNSKCLTIGNSLLELHLDLVSRDSAPEDLEAIEQAERSIVVEIVAHLVDGGVSIVGPKVNFNVVIIGGSLIAVES